MRYVPDVSGFASVTGTILAPVERTPMDQQTVDALLTSMLGTGHDISDLLFATGKPPLIEIHGRLHEFPVDTAS